MTRARVTPTLRRSGYTLSREERAGRSERGETRRRAGERSGYNTHHWPARLPLLKQVINLECGKIFICGLCSAPPSNYVKKLLNDEIDD